MEAWEERAEARPFTFFRVFCVTWRSLAAWLTSFCASSVMVWMLLFASLVREVRLEAEAEAVPVRLLASFRRLSDRSEMSSRSSEIFCRSSSENSTER